LDAFLKLDAPERGLVLFNVRFKNADGTPVWTVYAVVCWCVFRDLVHHRRGCNGSWWVSAAAKYSITPSGEAFKWRSFHNFLTKTD
jgi:hypothetical protein